MHLSNFSTFFFFFKLPSFSLRKTLLRAAMKTFKIPISFLLLTVISIEGLQGSKDKIRSLPGQPKVTFEQYSGYVTVDDKNRKSLFYYFAEAEIDPHSKPLVLWLNGGPGCSSVGLGAFSENGPFRPGKNGLVRNMYSWNKEANMLYLESPVGVGFSYSTNSSSYEGVNDSITARDNVVFMERWLMKFPQYRNRNLFIAGESYAGHYAPQLAKLMLDYNHRKKLFNLKGLALGNPLLDFETDLNSRAEYLWSHGLISDSTYNIFTSSCNYSRYMSEYFGGFVSPICSEVMSLVNGETSKFVDKYDVILDVCLPSLLVQSNIFAHPLEIGEKIDVCVEDETTNYLNRKDVQIALHARLVGVQYWAVCSDVLKYDFLQVEVPTISILGELVNAGIHVLVYSGDQDSVIPLLGTRKLVNRLAKELQLKTTVPYRAWFEEMQVGGWTQVYGDILSFATIRAASHEAPFSQPERSLALFKAFLEGKALPESF